MSEQLKAAQALSGDFNGGDDGGCRIGLAEYGLGIMLETAFRRFPDEPHKYMAWAISMIDSASDGNEYEALREEAHFYLLKQQYDDSNKKGGWSRESIDEFESFLAHEDAKAFAKAFGRFMKYCNLDDFASWKEAVNIRRPVTRLPINSADVITLDFSGK